MPGLSPGSRKRSIEKKKDNMYTHKLKTLMRLDIALAFILPIIHAAYIDYAPDTDIPYYMIATGTCTVWVVIKLLISRRYGQFHDIWFMLPGRWVSALLLSLVIIAAAYIMKLNQNITCDCLYIALLGYLEYRIDKYSYLQARRFRMDKIQTLEELVSKYPQAHMMLNKYARRQLKAVQRS